MSMTAEALTTTFLAAKTVGFFSAGGNQATSKQRDLENLIQRLSGEKVSLQAEMDQYSEKLVRLQNARQKEFELMREHFVTLTDVTTCYNHAEKSVKIEEYVQMLAEDAPRREEHKKELTAAISANKENIRQCDKTRDVLLKNKSDVEAKLTLVGSTIQTLRNSQEKPYTALTGLSGKRAPLPAAIEGYYADLEANIRAREDQIDALLENYKTFTGLVEKYRFLEVLTLKQQEKIESFQASFVESMENIATCEHNIEILKRNISEAQANLVGAEVSVHSPETHHHSDSANSSGSEGALSGSEGTQSDSEEADDLAIQSSTRRLSM